MRNVCPFSTVLLTLFLLAWVLVSAPRIKGQEIEVLFGHEFSTPIEFRVHKDLVFSRFENGLIALRGISDTNWIRTGIEINGFVERIVSNSNHIWVFTSYGGVYGSEDAGATWLQANDRFACLGEDVEGNAVAILNGRIARLEITNHAIAVTSSTIELQLDKAVEIAVKGDTVVACLPDRATVIIAVAGKIVSTASYEGPITRFTFGGSTTLHMLGYYLYRQASSLNTGFNVINEGLGLRFYTSVSTGISNFGTCFVVCGKEPKGFGFASAVRVYWPDTLALDRALVYSSIDIGDTLGTIMAASIVNELTYAMNWVGTTLINESGQWNHLDPRYRGIGTRGVWGITGYSGESYITQSINSLGPARPPLFRVYEKDRIVEPLEHNPALVDSVGAVLGYFPSPNGRQLIVGQDGWLTSEPGSSEYTVGGRRQVQNVQQLQNGDFVMSHGLRGMAISSDTGKTWRTRVAGPPFNPYLRTVESDSLMIFIAGVRTFIVKKDQQQDSIVALVLKSRILTHPFVTRAVGNEFEIVGLYRDSVENLILRFEEYVLDSLIKAIEIKLDSITGTTPAGYSNGDTVQLFFHYSLENLTFVGRELRSRRSLYSRATEQFRYADYRHVQFVSRDSVRIVRPSEGVATTIYVGDSPTTSVDQGIWHFYLENVHPNPAENKLSVDVGKFITADRSTVQLQLWTIEGRLELDFTSALPSFGAGNEKHTVSLNVSSVPNGPYLLVIRNSQVSRAEKVMIIR